MKKTSWHTLLRIVFLCGLLTLFSTAIVQADSSPVIYYACVNNGSLKLIGATDTCPDKQQRIFWNQTGPQGPAGPQGATGPQGTQGAQGPAGTNGLSAGYSTTYKVNSFISTSPVEVAYLGNLPAGNYIVNAVVSFSGNSNSVINCQLSPDPNTPVVQMTGANGGETLPITDGVNITGGQIALQCVLVTGITNTILSVAMTAIAVNTIQTTP